MDFNELLAKLPGGGEPARFPIADEAKAVRYIDIGLPQFVAPCFSARADAPPPPAPSIVIVSAAGAVGKSTVAREIARSKRAPYWDLSRTRGVAENSLAGQFMAAFGGQALAARGAMDSGDLMFVIDALDEGRLKSTEEGFSGFLREIAALARGRVRPAFLLLGRTQVSETAWLELTDAGAAVAFYTIDAFTQAQAESYIDLAIRTRDQRATRAVQRRPEEFRAARDLILSGLRDAIDRTATWETPAVREFLGYAPVLDAVAVLLTTKQDFNALSAELRSSAAIGDPATRPTALLSRVVARILEREKVEKIDENLRPELSGLAAKEKWGSWDSMYSVDEQAARLVDRILGIDKFSRQLPGEFGRRYEEQIATWLPEHPFLTGGRSPANMVFESFLFARVLADDVGGLRPAVEARISQHAYRPSRLLADFYLHCRENRKNEAIPASHIGHLYDSLLAGETPAIRVTLSVEGQDPEEDDVAGPSEAEVEFEFETGTDETPPPIRFQAVVDPTATITFGRYIKHASITAPCVVALGNGSSEFEVGPAVQVRALTLRIVTEALVVEGATRHRGDDERDPGVFIEALEYAGPFSARPTVRGALRVSWPGSENYPWTEFSVRREGAFVSDRNLQAAYRRFRRIATTFRSHKKGNLARFRDKIDSQRVLKGAVGEALLAQLLRDGVIAIEGKYYHWKPEPAARHVGITWEQLRQRDASPSLTAYLQNFVTSNLRLFA